MKRFRLNSLENFSNRGLRVLSLKKTVPSQLSETDHRRAKLAEKMEARHEKFQIEVAEAVKGFDPIKDKIEDFDFGPVAEVIRKSTVDEMSEMCGYDEVQRKILDSLLLERISKPLETIVKEQSDSESKVNARLFHVGYISGQIERCFSNLTDPKKNVTKLKMERARLQFAVNNTLSLQVNGAPADFVTKCDFIRKNLVNIFPEEQEDIDIAMKFIENNGSWFLSDFDESNELVVDKNEIGLLAARAVVDFAQQMYPQYDQGRILLALDDLVNLPDKKLQEIVMLQDRKRKDAVIDAQIILFAVRAANNAWALAVIPQGFAEQQKEISKMDLGLSEEEKRIKLAEWQASKPKMGAGRYTYNKEKNASFSTFDNMSGAKGWPEVLLDMDQIRTGIRILRQSYNSDSKQ